MACDPAVFSPAERAEHAARSRAVFHAIHRLIENSDGYTFVFPTAPALREQITDWVAFERRCCPFFTFELAGFDGHPAPTEGAVRTAPFLRIAGPDRTKAILRAALDEHGVSHRSLTAEQRE
ncbi:hypothetical protein [Pendulispora albinea]|uniref:Uncharacterized protein n=1 Tax=Pendulispora albinea TaxID=2741071 RepID=A0ABZ2LNY1_9BACT